MIFQLPLRTGLHTPQSIQNMEQCKQSIVLVSRFKFALVISELTRTLQIVDQMVCQCLFTRALYRFMNDLQSQKSNHEDF